jgi:hypothetical protein
MARSFSKEERSEVMGTMASEFEEGLKSARAIIALIEKIADRILNIADRKKRQNEITRLRALLNNVRIGRTLNTSLARYVNEILNDKLVYESAELQIMLLQL